MAVKLQRIGYGQVERQHMAAPHNGQIYAQLPALDNEGKAITQLENGQFLKYDYANGKAWVGTADDGKEWFLVYNEEKLYDERRQNHKDFVMKASDMSDGKIYPRLLRTFVGDIFTTNTFRTASTTSGSGAETTTTYGNTVTGPDDVITIPNITAGDYAIRELVAPEGYEKVETLFKFRVSFDANGKATVTSLGTDLPGSYDSEKDLISFENDPIKVTSEKGGMKVVVEEEGTGRRVPNATVEIEAPNGVKFPDGSTKIIVTTDENGEVTGYKDKSGKFIDLTTGLTPGDYKITVTKVPEGYKVTTGKTEVVTVKPGEVAEHLALIGTAVKKDEQTTEKTTETTTQKPSDTPSTEVKQPNTTTTPNAPSTPQKDTTVVNTGDSTNVVPIIIVMIISLIGIIFLVSRKRKMRYEY